MAWATAAWWFGIPTSESHALIAGLSGAAIALHGGFAGINGGEWIKVLYGLVLSTLLGFAFGWAAAKLVEFLCKNMDRRRTTGFFGGAQIARRRGYGVHARRTGRPEVYGRFHAGHLSGQRAGQRHQFPDPAVADGIVQLP